MLATISNVDLETVALVLVIAALFLYIFRHR